MTRFTLVLAGIAASLIAGRPVFGQNNQLDANIQLFTVLAAANAAGFDVGMDSSLYQVAPAPGTPNIGQLRLEIRKALAGKNIAVLDDLKRAYEKHKPRNSPIENYSQYISLALSIDGPPDFNWRGRQVDLPPEAVGLEDFRVELADFYRQAGIGQLWARSQPAFDTMLEVYHSPVAKMAFEITNYLRLPRAGFEKRDFQIFVDALGPPNFVQGRSWADDYFVIVTPSLEPRMQDIRHSFLRFSVDPLGIKFGLDLLQKRSLLDIAVSAPALPDIYKNDFVLLATECLIKAIESRLDHNPGAVNEALLQGYILTPYFSEQLPLYEKDVQSMRLYFPTMVEGINLQKETARLQSVQFAPAANTKLAKAPPASALQPAGPTTPAGKLLKAAQDASDNKDYDRAKSLFLQSLDAAGEGGEHARAYFGLARIAALQKDPELSERLFTKTLDASPDPQVKAWSLYYLGKLSDIAGDRAKARQYYEQALSVNGISEPARKAAEKELKQLPNP